ncbi:MAG: hypothetical protein KGN02_10200, partial [bacterium]|nr:hypothetical protein [bacterium]
MTPHDWTPTRQAGLARLDAFLPRAGRAYARERNADRGPNDRTNVSTLSPWIRRRLITEEEAIAAVLARHGYANAEKFIQEVCWRTYWKGWLELRPSMLVRFNDERIALKARLERDQALRSAVERAKAGETGIACFDAWARELVETGYLHNHARMWFASIWIFTLRLPWQIGSDFFYKHLLDADPASNTLSWRWVAGLQTRGKHYVARASNIREYTNGRFDPRGELDEAAQALPDDGAPPRIAPLAPADALPHVDVALLLTEEDLYPESLGIDANVRAVAAMPTPPVADPQRPAALFSAGALDDGLTRAAAHFTTRNDGVLVDADAVLAWARDSGASTIVTPYPPTG